MRSHNTSFYDKMRGEGLSLFKAEKEEMLKVTEVHLGDLDEALFDLD